MNRKRYFRKWVVQTLIAINILLVLVLSADCESLLMFVTSKMVALTFLGLNTLMLAKHSHLFED